MYTLDANIFARDTDPTDPFYPACRALLEALDQRQIPIIVPNLLLAEVAAAVSRTRRDPIRARIITDAITAFPHIKLIPLNDSLAKEAAELAADRALRGADAVYVAVALRAVSSFRWIANSVSAQHRLFAPSRHLKRWLSLAKLGGNKNAHRAFLLIPTRGADGRLLLVWCMAAPPQESMRSDPSRSGAADWRRGDHHPED